MSDGKKLPRNLVEICEETDDRGFSITVLGNTYCSLSLTKKVECPYQKHVFDHNGCLPCINPKYAINYNYDDEGLH